MILVAHPNPALDSTYVVPNFVAGHTYRIEQKWSVAGGKAFNCARALRSLQQAPLVICALAGYTGRRIAELAAAEDIAVDPVWYTGETRTNLNVLDPLSECSTDFYEFGNELPVRAWEEMLAKVKNNATAAAAVIGCGSLTPGADPHVFKMIVDVAHSVGAPAYLDTYGPPLVSALEAHPELIKINQHEVGDILGWEVDTPQAALAAASEVCARGARAVVITLGALGAVGTDARGSAFTWTTPKVRVVNVAGSGDVMFAGIIAGLQRKMTLAEATRSAIALGAANVQSVVAGQFDPTAADQMLPEIRPLWPFSESSVYP